jgi:hypothetical protein
MNLGMQGTAVLGNVLVVFGLGLSHESFKEADSLHGRGGFTHEPHGRIGVLVAKEICGMEHQVCFSSWQLSIPLCCLC